jgi:hypothetical protein
MSNKEDVTVIGMETEWNAVWHDKDTDRRSQWYIYANGEKVGIYPGSADSEKVDDYIRNYLAKRSR